MPDVCFITPVDSHPQCRWCRCRVLLRPDQVLRRLHGRGADRVSLHRYPQRSLRSRTLHWLHWSLPRPEAAQAASLQVGFCHSASPPKSRKVLGIADNCMDVLYRADIQQMTFISIWGLPRVSLSLPRSSSRRNGRNPPVRGYPGNSGPLCHERLRYDARQQIHSATSRCLPSRSSFHRLNAELAMSPRHLRQCHPTSRFNRLCNKRQCLPCQRL